MICLKCGCEKFRPFIDGSICVNCGKLILAEIPIVLNHIPQITLNAGARVGMPRKDSLRAGACYAYIEDVFPTIKAMLLDLKSWPDISGHLGWDRPVCTTIKTLKKYYRYELERRC